MKHIFYLIVGILALYEAMKALNCKRVYVRTNEFTRLKNKQEKEKYISEHPLVAMMGLIDTLGWITLIGGLMTSQWFLFLAVMVLSLSKFQRLGSWAVCIDSIVTFAIYMFAVINTYHLHIEYGTIY